MARVEFAVENKKQSTNYDYPKLKLKSGEYARILLLESPVVEYVHTLRAPQIVNGKPQTFLAERKDGSKYEDYKMDFLSRPICLGDAAILDDKGSDAKNCPICALAKENGDMAQAPQRRFAMHVIRYRTKPGGHTLITPYSVETIVWAFTDKTFNKIVDFKAEWGDLRKHDLTLGPCTNETFQQFEISIAAKAAWLEDKERQKLTAQTFKENQIEDLSIACGSKKEMRWIEEDLSKIRENWGIAVGVESAADTGGVGTLDEGIDDLLGSTSDETDADSSGDVDDLLGTSVDAEGWHKEETPKADAVDDDLLGDLLDTDSAEGGDEPEAEVEKAPAKKPAAKKAAAKKAEPEAEPEAADEGAGDFDDLLADLLADLA